MVAKVISASVTNLKLAEKSYREALANSEETLGVANATRFKVDKFSTICILCVYIWSGLHLGMHIHYIYFYNVCKV